MQSPILLGVPKVKRGIQNTLDALLNSKFTIILRDEIPEFHIHTTLSWGTCHHANINGLVEDPACYFAEHDPFGTVAVGDVDFCVGTGFGSQTDCEGGIHWVWLDCPVAQWICYHGTTINRLSVQQSVRSHVRRVCGVYLK